MDDNRARREANQTEISAVEIRVESKMFRAPLLNFIKLIAQILLFISYVHVIFDTFDKYITIRSYQTEELIVSKIKVILYYWR